MQWNKPTSWQSGVCAVFLDDDDDIFKPPKLTDEDFSPFGSKGGLFSGGTGLFDDDEEVRDDWIRGVEWKHVSLYRHPLKINGS